MAGGDTRQGYTGVVHVCTDNTGTKRNTVNMASFLTGRKRRLIAVVCFVILLLYTNFWYNLPNRYEFSNTNVHGICTLPKLNPFDPDIMKYNWHPDTVKCEKGVSLMYIDRKGFLHFNTTALGIQKVSKADIDCRFSPVERNGDFEVNIQPEIRFVEPVYIQSDFIVVKCRDRSRKIIYENIHINIDYKSVLASKKILNETRHQLSVLLFGVDSLSKNMAIRKLPKTMKYVEEVLGGITFQGYTKVGHNTFPNMIPLLTGRRADPKEFGHLWNSPNFDSWPLIGYNFSAAEYVTMFSEDWPDFSTFNYLTKGFKVQPTDHYIRPLYLTMQKCKPWISSLDQVFLYLENKDIKLKSSSLCYGNQLKHQLFLEYFRRFLDVYKNKRKFAHTWMNELSHDYSNFLELADQDFVDLLKWMKDEGHLDHAVLMLVADHGSRTEEIRNTVPGRVEERMPLLSVVIPEVLKQQYPEIMENMWQNAEVITTAYDVYATMSDVIHRRFDYTFQLMPDGNLPRGISLFKRIPKERTCADAGILEEYCACFTSRPVDIQSKPVQLIAAACVEKINSLLGQYKDKCAHLVLSKIKDAQLIESSFRRNEKNERFTLRKYFGKPQRAKKRYLVLFETSPSRALFEVTTDFDEGSGVTVTGDIIRANKYGNQSQCVHDRVLRNYCFCI